MLSVIYKNIRTLVIQWLWLMLPLQEARIRSLVGDLTRTPQGVTQKNKKIKKKKPIKLLCYTPETNIRLWVNYT